MTANQIKYAEHIENARHNTATELQTDKAQAETNRHNVAQESHNVNVLQETRRHNQATEQVAKEQIAQGWSNISLGHQQLREQTRHNVEQESIGKADSHSKAITAKGNLANAYTNAAKTQIERFRAESQVDQWKKQNALGGAQILSNVFGGLANGFVSLIR
nr:MAG: hypothetical protein [Picobirnavirus sp.]